MIDLSIIIVNYNVKEFLQNLLESVYKAAGKLSIEIIVVDNASDDGSPEIIKQRFPQVKLIENKVNVGFGKANNQALEIAGGKYIVLINPDTIVKEDTFSKLIDFFNKTPDAGLAGCKILNPDGSLQLACRRSFPGPWTSFTKVFGLSSLFPKSKLFAKYNLTYLDENQTYEVDAISGAFMMMRRDVYEKIGGFDPAFFMYGEDLDFCYRTQQAGFKVYYFHETEVIHFKGESTKRSKIDETKIFYDAMHLFVKKHFSSSFVVSWILQFAIILRKIVAFASVYRMVILAMFFDFLFFIGAIVFAEYLYKSGHWLGFPGFVKPWIYILPGILQILISASFGAYKKNSISVLKSWLSLLFGLVLLSALTFFLKQFAFSRAVVLITYLLLFILYPLWRLVYKFITRQGLGEGAGSVRTVIVGTGNNAVELAAKLKSDFQSIHNVLGLISLDMRNLGEEKNGFKIIGSIDNIVKIISAMKIDKVIFSAQDMSFEKMFSVVSMCQDENVDFLVSGSKVDYLVGKSMAGKIDDVPLLKVFYNISVPTHKFIKRSFDLFFSSVILLLLYPLVYFIHKVSGSNTDFINFILETPKVFSGKKSFVGPKSKSFYEDLFLGKPGLTGLWFIENVDDSDEDEMVKLDLYYAKNQNLWLDLEILGRTFGKMFYSKEIK